MCVVGKFLHALCKNSDKEIQKNCKKKRIVHSPLSLGMQENVPEHGGKVRNTCIKIYKLFIVLLNW
jgi:hypothetical protein